MIILNVPNVVTLSRIILIPLLVGLYYLPESWLSDEGRNLAATAVFIFAGLTDWLDGFLARRLNQMSAFGAFLDPVADKLIVVGALVILLYLNRVDMLVALIISQFDCVPFAPAPGCSTKATCRHVVPDSTCVLS